MKISFTKLKIDQISHSSGVFSGENQQKYWHNEKKINEGFGEISGKNNSSLHSNQAIRNHQTIKRRV